MVRAYRTSTPRRALFPVNGHRRIRRYSRFGVRFGYQAMLATMRKFSSSSSLARHFTKVDSNPVRPLPQAAWPSTADGKGLISGAPTGKPKSDASLAFGGIAFFEGVSAQAFIKFPVGPGLD